MNQILASDNEEELLPNNLTETQKNDGLRAKKRNFREMIKISNESKSHENDFIDYSVLETNNNTNDFFKDMCYAVYPPNTMHDLKKLIKESNSLHSHSYSSNRRTRSCVILNSNENSSLLNDNENETYKMYVSLFCNSTILEQVEPPKRKELKNLKLKEYHLIQEIQNLNKIRTYMLNKIQKENEYLQYRKFMASIDEDQIHLDQLENYFLTGSYNANFTNCDAN